MQTEHASSLAVRSLTTRKGQSERVAVPPRSIRAADASASCRALLLWHRTKRLLVTCTAVATPVGHARCAAPPRALHWHASGITQSLPIRQYLIFFSGFTVFYTSDDTVTLESIEVTDPENFTVSPAVVVVVHPSDRIDWYAPPGTAAMQSELAHSMPVRGFRLPPHTKDRYQAVIPLAAVSGSTGATDASQLRPWPA